MTKARNSASLDPGKPRLRGSARYSSSSTEDDILRTINPVTMFHRNHHHKVSSAIAAAGIGFIVFPEPIVTDVIGLSLVGLALIFAFLSDHFTR